jgi:ABC-type Fe3+-hydroxamate transport system substrate-binding protein
MKYILNLLCLSILLLFTGCGSDNNSSNENNPNINELNLPPDPGEAGKLTIEGIDSDNDGVRDEIQRYIALEYPNSKKVRKVLTEMTKVNQAFILNANDKDKVLEAVEKRNKQSACAFYIDPNGAYHKLKKLKAKLLNTKERTMAYIKADSQLSSMTFRLADDEKAQCSFDPDLLED